MDLDLSVLVTRDWLGLGPLEVNDQVAYRSAPELLGTQVSWNNNRVGSPWIDGEFTVSRTRGMVEEPVGVEVTGRTLPNQVLTGSRLQANFAALIDAFTQDSYTLTVTIDGVVYAYECEAAGYQVTWSGPRFMARRGKIAFTVPRQPAPVLGGV